MRLTHPGGRLEGGPLNPLSTQRASAKDNRIRLSTSGELLDSEGRLAIVPPQDTGSAESTTYEAYLAQILSSLPASAKGSSQSLKTAMGTAIADEVKVQLEELKKQMRAREEAVKKNNEVERKIADMEMQRRVERRVEEGMRRKGKV